jgi:hypothetical protein
VNKRAGIGIVTLIASIALGFLGYRALDRYVYENGISINLKLYAIAAALALLMGLAGLVIARAISRGKRLR